MAKNSKDIVNKLLRSGAAKPLYVGQTPNNSVSASSTTTDTSKVSTSTATSSSTTDKTQPLTKGGATNNHSLDSDKNNKKLRVSKRNKYVDQTDGKAEKFKREAENAFAAAQTLRTKKGVSRTTYLKIYELEHIYIDRCKHSDDKNIQNNILAIQQYWRDFYQRSWCAWLLAIAYGGLQGWGMAGFAGMMMDSVDLDPWTSHVIALAVATPVALMNTWLVQPDLEDYITFEKHKKLFSANKANEDKIHPGTIILCGFASLLLGAVTAFGITTSLQDENAYIQTDNPLLIGLALGGMTAVLTCAEALLNIQSFDDALKEGFWQQETNLYAKYIEGDKTTLFGLEIEKRTKAKIVYNASFIFSCLGMLGLALVGTDTLTAVLLNETSAPNATEELSAMTFSCGILTLAAATQIPFYRDRAKRITETWVPIKDTVEAPHESFRPVFNDKSVISRGVSSSLWAANALFNAPCAYLGVVSTLAQFMNLSEQNEKSGSLLQDIFCQYGTENKALIAYGIGAAFFLCAVAISLAANYPPVTKMADPKNELAEKIETRNKKIISV